MNSKELRMKLEALRKELETIAKKASDQVTDEDRAAWVTKRTEYEDLAEKLRIELDRELFTRANAGSGLSVKDLRDMGRYSFRKAILAQLKGQELDGIELEMHQEAQREARELGFAAPMKGFGVPYALLSNKPLSRASTGQNVTTVADGGYLVQEEPLLYYNALANKLLLPGMGAKFLTGLVGDLPLIEGGSFTASWLDEDATDTATKMAFDELVMKPNRLQVTGALSIQLLRQASVDVERYIEEALVTAHAQGLQTAAINGSGTPPEPRGILNKVGIGAVTGGDNGAVPTWANIVDLETEVATDNAEGPSMAYLTNAKVRGKLKQTEKASGTAQFIWDLDEMNGYPAMVTNAVPSTLSKGNQSSALSAIIFGDFSKLHIGQWGNLEIIVDPYSLKKKAEVEITVISYGDIGIVQPEAFAAMKDVITV